jgi:hypothetical protein
MTQTAIDFLDSWTHAYIKADPRDRGTLPTAVAQCFADAGRVGISKDALSELAGGDLGAHLTKSVA